MLAPKDATILNEPLLARHARYMHNLAKRAFRTRYMQGFSQVHATEVLRSAHERRATDVKALNGAELMRDIAMEDMRRSIHNTYVARSSAVLVLAFLLALFGAYSAYSWGWNNTDTVKEKFSHLRGYNNPEAQKTIREKAVARAQKIMGTAKEKYEERKQQTGKDPLDAIKRWGGTAMEPKSLMQISFGANDAGLGGAKSKKQADDGVAVDLDKQEEAAKKIYAKAVEIAKKRAAIFQKVFGKKPGDKAGQ